MAVTNFFWDDQNLLQEYDAGGVTTVQYVTEPSRYGNVIGQRASGQSSYFHFDGIGSMTDCTSVIGSVTDTRRYSAFGKATEQAGLTLLHCQYVGQWGYYYDHEFDAYYVRLRYYRSDVAIWESQDSLGIRISDLNPYCYVKQSPMTSIDPSGAITFDCYRRQAIRCGILEAFSGQLQSCFLSCGQQYVCAGLLGPPFSTLFSFGDCMDNCVFVSSGRFDSPLGAAIRACTLALVIRHC